MRHPEPHRRPGRPVRSGTAPEVNDDGRRCRCCHCHAGRCARQASRASPLIRVTERTTHATPPMLPPLLRVLLDEPRLVTKYASVYATLLKEDAAWWKAKQMRRLGYLLSGWSAGNPGRHSVGPSRLDCRPVMRCRCRPAAGVNPGFRMRSYAALRYMTLCGSSVNLPAPHCRMPTFSRKVTGHIR